MSHLLRWLGTLTEAQSNAVYRLNEAELSNNREQSPPVVRLLRQLPFPTAYDTSPLPIPFTHLYHG